MTAKKLLEMIDDDRYCVFVRLLRFYFVDYECDLNTARHQKFCLQKMEYLSCCRAPTLTGKMQNGSVVFDNDG